MLVMWLTVNTDPKSEGQVVKVDFAAPQVHGEVGVSLLQHKTVHVEVNCWSNGVTGTVHSDLHTIQIFSQKS